MSTPPPPPPSERPIIADEAPPTNPALLLLCSVCQEGPFGSRNQLFAHLRTKHYADDALFPSVSPLEALYQSGAERTAASVAARGTYENSVHDRYYQAQQQASISDDDDGNNNNGTASWTTADWDEAKAFFQKPLPVAFRTLLPTATNNNNNATKETSSSRHYPRTEVDVRYHFLHRLHQLTPEDALQSCQAVPSQLALKASQPPRQWSPEAQRCLMDAQDVGAVSRQEVCSMIPPLLLLLPLPSEHSTQNSKEPSSLLLDNNHAGTGLSVLDLCSAPGSKSLQLLDMMHYMAANRDTNSSDENIHNATTANNDNNFMLVCNDANRLRLLTVARRSRRQPAHYRPSCLLNSSDGRYFPSLCKWGGYKFKFSRVLADVPCSGDGTLRKLSRREWEKWNVRSHLQLHPLQIRLLTRALECVQKGGRVVYSTCSLDPIEDEAVVVSAIARMVGGPHSYKIVPMPATLSFPPMTGESNTTTQRFPHSKGATRWIVPHPEFGQDVKIGKRKKTTAAAAAAADGTDEMKDDEQQTAITYDTYASIDQVPVKLRRRDISPSMFPPDARTEDLFRKAYEEQQESLKIAHQEKAKRSENAGKEKTSDNKDNSNQKEKVPMSVEEKIQQAKRWGEILSPEDMDAFESMLPNCARIFPQHLDSGGFFCAVIERVAPTYFAICYPRHREALEGVEGSDKNDNVQIDSCESQPDYKYHGRILYPVESAKQVRDLIAKDKGKNEDVVFEGVATKELAIRWLRKHKCYTEKISDETIPLTSASKANDGDRMDAKSEHEELKRKSQKGGDDTNGSKQEKGEGENDQPTKRVKRQVNDPTKSAIYTPLFAPPHPSLVAELCDFFGLHTDPEDARKALVDVFPADRLVVWIGSGEEEAAAVTCCLDPEKAHKLVRREDMADTKEVIARKRRFLQLTLVSDEMKTLYKGGAKFSPMEVGLVLCWVPVPGLYREPYENESSKTKKKKPKGGEADTCVESNGVKEYIRFEDSTARAVKSGRYGVLDEAVEFLGRTATKRLVALTRSEALQLLASSSLDVASNESSFSQTQNNDINDVKEDAWWWESKWGKQRLPDLKGWGAGAVIAVVLCGQLNSSSSGDRQQKSNNNNVSCYSNIYLPCVLQRSSANEVSPVRLELLAEQRLTDAYKRLLECTA